MTLKKINILEYAFVEGGGGRQKAYAVYAFINVDNCERPLTVIIIDNYLCASIYSSHQNKNYPVRNEVNQVL